MNASPPTASLPDQLNQLEQANLIRPAPALPELAYVFRHALIQESAYKTLVRADRRRVHRAAGEALEALLAGSETPAALAPLLARHFEEAADHARALRYYSLAGDAALAGYANAEAVAAYTRALAAAEHLLAAEILSAAEHAPVESGLWQHLFEARGRALELSAEYAEALRNYQAMAARAASLGDRRLALAAMVAEGQLYATATPLFDPPRAERMAEAALAEAGAIGDEPAESKILWNQLNLYRFSGRNEAARAAGERSLEVARRLDLKAQAALTVNDLVHIYAALRLWPQFQQASAEARRLWGELGNVAMLADSLSTAAMYQASLGEFAPALSHALEAQRQAIAIHNLWGQSYSLLNMIWPYWYTGHPDRAIAAADECLRVGREAWPFAAGMGGAWLASMVSELGDTAGGFELLRQATGSGGSAEMGGPWLMATRIHLELLTGGLAAASAALAASGDETPPPGSPEREPVLRARSEVALAAALAGGESGRALAASQAYVASLRDEGLRAYLPEALAGLAQALLLPGRVDEARQQLVEALATARDTGALMLEWPVLYALGRLEIDRGDPAAAEPHWAAAREIVRVIVDRIPTPALRQSFLARPELRALLAET